MTQLTFDAGYSGTPALSSDGTLLAFASDRAGDGNLDIWVQPVAGGAAIQVTRDTADERMPVFSPDGGRIVFRSERDGGGIYSVPALGGDARLIVGGGLSPRLSPDGRQLAYWTGSFIGFGRAPGSYHTYVVDAGGGTPREIGGFTNSRFPVWSPDGQSLIVSAIAGRDTGRRDLRLVGGAHRWWPAGRDRCARAAWPRDLGRRRRGITIGVDGRPRAHVAGGETSGQWCSPGPAGRLPPSSG